MIFAATPERRRAGRIALLCCRLLLAAVFVSAATAKLAGSPEGFADSIASFRLVPAGLVNPLALGLPPFELLVGMALLANLPRRLGAFCALALGAVFLVALTTALIRGLPVDCGCFGAGASWLPLTTAQRMWFDLGRDFLLVLAASGLYRSQLAVVNRAATP